MKREKKMLVAFFLNLFFCVFEFIGGSITGSTAIVSDAVHDTGDAMSIGVSYLLERKGVKSEDKKIRERYSFIGGIFTSAVLIAGSIAAMINAVYRFINPVKPDYDGMLVFAVAGVAVNSVAAFITHGKDSVSLRAVNLHMLEDVLGWGSVLVGALVMRFTDFYLIDPALSVCVSLFITVSAVKNITGHGHSHSHSQCSQKHHH